MYAATIATAVNFEKHLELLRLCVDVVQLLAGGAGETPTASGAVSFILMHPSIFCAWRWVDAAQPFLFSIIGCSSSDVM